MKVKCSAGELCVVNSTHAQSCRRGNYCPDGKEEFVCSSGSFCEINSAQPLPCIAGKYCPDPSEEFICPEGHFCIERSLSPKPCPLGTFRPDTGGAEETACRPCPPDTSTLHEGSTDENQCLCDVGFYVSPHKPTDCIVCNEESMVCGSVGTVVETIMPAPGFWRSDSSSLAFIPCPYGPDACSNGIDPTIHGDMQLPDEGLGANTTIDSYGDSKCMDGHEGFVCAACVQGFYRDSSSAEAPCTKCSDVRSQLVWLVGMAILGLGLSVYIINRNLTFGKKLKEERLKSVDDRAAMRGKNIVTREKQSVVRRLF